jgi:hypothetical protein
MISQSCRIQRKPAHTLAAREALETTRRECKREEPLLIHEGCEEGNSRGARVAVNTTRLGAAFAWTEV